MTTKIEKTLVVDVPVRVAYNQWTQFEEFPNFMAGVDKVEQLDDRRLHWVAKVAGVKREWDATIVEQVADTKIAWAATEGATNAGAVYFADAGATKTTVTLSLEYEPEGLVAKAGDKLDLIEKQVEKDLARFKELVEARGYETGGWRGAVDHGGAGETPGVDAAASSLGDKGKTGIAGKVAVAGAATLAAGAAGVAAAGARKGSNDQPEQGEEVVVEETIVVEEVTPVTGEAGTPEEPIVLDEPAHTTTGDATPGGRRTP